MVSYERLQKFQAEIGRADYRNYLAMCWELLVESFSEWYGVYQLITERLLNTPKEEQDSVILNTPELYGHFEDLVIFSINLWFLLKQHIGADPLDKRDKRVKDYKTFTDFVLDIHKFYNDKDKVIIIMNTLGESVSQFIPLSDRREIKDLPSG